MLITKLQIAGFRSIEQAEFTFQPGMNLLVGVNGVGKTTVLDALRICLSRVLPEITASQSRILSFKESDIRYKAKGLRVSCDIKVDGKPFSCSIEKRRQLATPTGKQTEGGSIFRIKLGDISIVYPDLDKLLPNYKESKKQPLAVYFSTRRSVLLDRDLSLIKEQVIGGQSAAFTESLSERRDVRLRPIAEWFKAQQVLGNETTISQKHVEAMQLAVAQFLPHFNNLRVIGSDKNVEFRVDKDGLPFRISQLSDGERGVFAIVLDLARRLSQSNPGLENPIKEGSAVVLIDELDLHLHPKWQRSVVENLTRTFQNCQFIATTHSPQIIPAVDPEQVQLFKNNQVIHPDRTLGMDTNWILRNLMETDDRPEEATEAIKHIQELIKEGDYEEARATMIGYRQDGLDLPEWSMLEARIARFETFDEE